MSQFTLARGFETHSDHQRQPHNGGHHVCAIAHTRRLPRRRLQAGLSSFAQDIPPDWRVCGENLFAQHSIAYDALPSYFLGFQVWNERNVCLSWDETQQWFELLGVTPVDVIFDGIFDERAIRALYDGKRDWSSREGYVVRVADAFSYGDYRTHVMKFVRQGHVQTNKHWMHGQRIVRNQLAT